MRQHLRHRPVKMPRIAQRDAFRGDELFAHPPGLQPNLHLDIQRAMRLIPCIKKIR